MATNKAIYLSVDIKKAGESYDHALLAVEMCLGSLEAGVIEKKGWYISTKGQNVCLKSICSHWNPIHMDLLEMIADRGLPSVDQARSIWEYLKSVEARYPRYQYDTVLISDDPTFVFGQLGYFLHRELSSSITDYMFPIGSSDSQGNKRRVVNPSERKLCLDINNEVSGFLYWVRDTEDDDATKNFWTFVVTEAALRIRDRKRDYREKLKIGLEVMEQELAAKQPLTHALIYRVLELR